MSEEETFLSHLVELRDRIIRSAVVVVLMFLVCFYFHDRIMNFLMQPLYHALPAGSSSFSPNLPTAIFNSLPGAFFTQTKVAFLSAVLLSLPWIVYQAWAFVAPGLYDHEKRFALPLIISSVVFLVLGIAFAYTFVLPAAFRFFYHFAANTGAAVMQDLQQYWDFTLSIFFGFGLTFEVPVVEMLLVKMGMVTTQQLKSIRRYVIVAAFAVAAVLTPPDVMSQFMLAIPLYLLYELGIFLAGFVKAHSAAPEAEPESEPGEARPPTVL